MGTLNWSQDVVVSWGDTDQADRLKLVTAMRMVWDGYQQFPELLAGMSRPEYFRTTGWQPITVCFEVTVNDISVDVDRTLHVEVTDTEGSVPGSPPRYGGLAEVSISDGTNVVATARSYWYWYSPATGKLLNEPAPLVLVDQEDELAPPPRPPSTEGALPAGSFRWTQRETDINKHVYAGAYIERAENAIADLRLDDLPRRSVRIWFRNQAFAGDSATVSVLSADDSIVVVLADEGAGPRCTLQFD